MHTCVTLYNVKIHSDIHDQVMGPCLFARWQDVSKYNISVFNHLKLYTTLTANNVRHEGSQILPCPSPLIMNYDMKNYSAVEACFKELFERILGENVLNVVLSSFVYTKSYVIRHSNQGDRLITQGQMSVDAVIVHQDAFDHLHIRHGVVIRGGSRRRTCVSADPV